MIKKVKVTLWLKMALKTNSHSPLQLPNRTNRDISETALPITETKKTKILCQRKYPPKPRKTHLRNHFWTLESGFSAIATYKTRVFSKRPLRLIFNFFLVVHNIVSDIIHSKIRPNNFFPYIRILTRCAMTYQNISIHINISAKNQRYFHNIHINIISIWIKDEN